MKIKHQINKDEIFFNEEWHRAHVEKIKKRAGPRYTPELNIDLPIVEIFDGLVRNKQFYNSIRKHYGIIKQNFNNISQDYKNKETTKVYGNLKENIFKLLESLSVLKEYNTKKIPWNLIYKQSQKVRNIIFELFDRLREEKNGADRSLSDKINSDIHYSYKVQKSINYFTETLSKSKAKLSNHPFLLLTGVAGTGKTHLLCDIVSNSTDLFPSILVFGELFKSNKDPFSQIIQQLNLNINKNQFLKELSDSAKKINERAVIVIDALNETSQRDFWKTNLNKIINEIKKYPNIGLVISIRTGFENDIINKNLENDFFYIEHPGFSFKEQEAVTKFFNKFNLPLPEIPLLTPEFQNPLFLLLFCKAFENRKETKQAFRGHEGATYIFESFIKRMSRKISKDFNIPKTGQNNIWNKIIKSIAFKMVEQNRDRITEEQIISLVQTAYPSIDYNNFLMKLENNLLISKVPIFSKEKQDYDGFYFRFPFQKFSDHLIGRYIFKKYKTEFGESNRKLCDAKKFFSKRRKIGKFLDNWANKGVVEALSVQCPEYLGYELIEVAPYLLKNPHMIARAFLESLIWRKIKAFPKDIKHTLSLINKVRRLTFRKARILSNDDFFNTILTISPAKKHPFNAKFLHNRLSRFSMAERDSFWSVFLHNQYGQNSSVERMIEWAWSYQNKDHINREAIYLYSISLSWFLATPNRFIRDKSTKALITLLTNRLDVILDLLKEFETVNDPYITERLYAVACGCAIRSRKNNKNLKSLSQWVYDKIFKSGNPPEHIFIRDYARGIIETALNRRINLELDRKGIEPPFNSKWPENIPSKDFLKNKYHSLSKRGTTSIWNSVMYGDSALADFENYVVKYAVQNWSRRRIGEKKIDHKELLNNFINKLNPKQKALLEKVFNNLDRNITLKSIISGDSITSLLRVPLHNFENSLSDRKKLFFKKEIKPLLNKNNDRDDSFDRSLARRWIFHRVMKMGWKEELHGQFDDRMKSGTDIDRSEHKPERIGKKYQWIALYELLAKISDNFEFKSEYNSNQEKYKGSWQIGIRNIDPSCILKDRVDEAAQDIPSFNKYEIQGQYKFQNQNIENSAWLRQSNDLPDPMKMTELIDGEGNRWITLGLSFSWKEESLPEEEEEYGRQQKMLWYMLKSYIVRVGDKGKIFEWAKKQNFYGRWMPESNEFHDIYLGEYPWAPAFLHRQDLNYNGGWTNQNRNNSKGLPTDVLVTDDQYSSSGSSIDCSTDEVIRASLPVKFIVDEMQLVQTYVDGRFLDKEGDLVAFDPSIFHQNIPSQVLVRKDKLLNFFKRKGYSLIWTLLGEKNIVGMRAPGHLLVNGAYTLGNGNKVIGKYRGEFKSYHRA